MARRFSCRRGFFLKGSFPYAILGGVLVVSLEVPSIGICYPYTHIDKPYAVSVLRGFVGGRAKKKKRGTLTRCVLIARIVKGVHVGHAG